MVDTVDKTGTMALLLLLLTTTTGTISSILLLSSALLLLLLSTTTHLLSNSAFPLQLSSALLPLTTLLHLPLLHGPALPFLRLHTGTPAPSRGSCAQLAK